MTALRRTFSVFVKIRHRREAKHAMDRERICEIKFTLFRKTRTRREPERKLTASRMPRRINALQIERRVFRDRAQIVGRVRDIEKRPRPAAACIADAPIFNRPGREPAIGKPRRQPRHVNVIELRHPTAAMHEHDDRKRPGAFRQTELAKLLRTAPVSDALRRRRQRHRGELRPTERFRASWARRQKHS